MAAAAYSGLELLATALVALDRSYVVRYANPAAEYLLATGAKSLVGQPFLALFADGSAQLLERELDRQELREYTRVIIKEADRLQALLDRLLTPRRAVQLTQVNIHAVLERVRSLVQAEFPQGISCIRNYDPSVPALT